jgi:hypothetical protein
MNFVKRHTKAFAIGSAIAVLTTAGIGIAAWLTSGPGNLYGKTGTLTAPNTLDVSATLTGDIFPGGTGDLTVAWNNPNVAPQWIQSIVASGTPTVVPATCAPSQFSTDFSGIQAQLNLMGAAGRQIPAGDNDPATAEKTIVFDNVLSLDIAAPTECQNAVFVRPATFNYSTAAS